MPKILAIDDKPDNLVSISALLKNLIPDCTVLTSRTGVEGIRMAQDELPDTVLLDIVMPEMDGFEVCKRLKSGEKTKHIPIVMLTAMKKDSESRVKGLEVGADAFLSKPIEDLELVAQVKAMLRIKRAEDMLREERDQLGDLAQERAKKLRESEEKFRSVFEDSTIGMVITDRNGRYHEVNQAMSKILGYSRQELLSMTVREFTFPGDPDTGSDFMGQLWAGEIDGASLEKRYVRKDGHLVWAAITISPLRDADGKIVYTLGQLQDITKRKQMEEALRDREERYRVLFNSSPDAVFVNRPTTEGVPGKFIDANDVACRRYGYRRDELFDLTPLDLRAPDHVDDFDSIVAELLPSGALLRETVHVTKDGRRIPVEVHTSRFELEGRPTVLSIVRDFTDRKKAEALIKQSLKEKEVLLGEIHHRVKNNMQVISSLLRLQAANIKDKKYEAMLKESQVRIQAMALVHEQLYQTKDFTSVNFNAYIKSLVNKLLRFYGINTDKIRAKIEVEDVPIAIDSAIPCGLLINELVSNALKHAFPAGEKGEVMVALRSINENELELIVADDGIGLPEGLDVDNTESFGMELISLLAEDQLGGKMEIDRTSGTKYQIRFKKKICL